MFGICDANLKMCLKLCSIHRQICGLLLLIVYLVYSGYAQLLINVQNQVGFSFLQMASNFTFQQTRFCHV